jgi:putative aldouronate transport system permease protein
MLTSHLKRVTPFDVVNGFLLTATGVLCLLPFLHIIAVSFSAGSEVSAGRVAFWPSGFTLASYEAVLKRSEFWTAMMVSVVRVILGLGVSTLMTVLAAYPLSKPRARFRRRGVYVWVIFITMLFSGGLIPTYMLIYQLGMLDTIWALVLPAPFGVPVFNVLILLNFFRTIPVEMEEAARIDGAGSWRTLFRIYLPMSLPAMATLALFVAVGHWNSWFDGMIFMQRPARYPLQTFLRTVVTMPDVSYMTNLTIEKARELMRISDRTAKSAQIFIAAIPILCVYPFLQRYFVKGIVLGSVKG